MSFPATALPSPPPHTPRCGPVGKSRNSKRRALALILVHVVVLVHVAHWKIAGTTLTPVEPSEAMQTLELGYLNAGFVLFAVAILLTLIFGRFFCGWACHVVAYQDLCAWILKRFGLKPKPVRSRLLVFVPLGAAFYMFVWPSLARAYADEAAPAIVRHFTTSDLWRTFPGPWIGALTLLVDGALIVWFLGAKGFCTYGCPYGAIFGIADRAAPVRIRVTDACEGCGHCTATCTSNVRVHQEVALYKMVVDPGCMKCLDCVSVCPKEALYVGWGPPAIVRSRSSKAVKAAKAPPKRYDLTIGEELLAAGVFFLALYAFRNLYHAVPFLLAIGLSVIAAVGAVVLRRLPRRSDLTVQHVAVRRDGRFTKAGIAIVAAFVLLFAFAAHSSAVQYFVREGEREFAELAAARKARAPIARGQVAREPLARGQLLSALAAFSRADSLGLFPDGSVDLAMASLLDRLGDPGAAESRARAATEHDPKLTRAWLVLADLEERAGKRKEAEQDLLRLLEIEPGNAEALRKLDALRAR